MSIQESSWSKDRHGDRQEHGRLRNAVARAYTTTFYHRTSKSLRVINVNLDFQMVSEVRVGALISSSVSAVTTSKHLDTWHMVFMCPLTVDQPQKKRGWTYFGLL